MTHLVPTPQPKRSFKYWVCETLNILTVPLVIFIFILVLAMLYFRKK
jgi:hypothetical protein